METPNTTAGSAPGWAGCPRPPIQPVTETICAGSAAEALTGLGGAKSGTSADSQDSLTFSVLAGVRPMIEEFPLERAADPYDHMISGGARFRVVLKTS